MTIHPDYRPEIDGLRALAVVPVILFHSGLPIFPGGFVGVDVFFVISGYLITTILIAEVGLGRFSILRFYERRARRILPALFVVLAACIPLAYLWLLPEQFSDFAASLGAVLVFLSNIYFMSQVSYFAPASELQPLLHTWSLGVEEQYYLVFPLIVVLAMRSGRRRLFVAVLALTIASFVLSEFGQRVDAGRNFFFTLSRFWELGVGSLCAILLAGRRPKSNQALSVAGLALTLAPAFLYSDRLPFPGLWVLAPVGGAALLILFAGSGTLAARLLSHRIPVGIGLISYSAYLVHQPLFAFARIRSADELAPMVLLGLSVLSLALGWLSWRYVEQPFRGQTPVALPGRRSYAVAAVLVAAALMSVAMTVRLNDGIPGRATERYAGEIGARAFLDYGKRFFPCQPDSARLAVERYEHNPRCLQSRPEGLPEVVVLGDSHAEHLFYGVASGLADRNVAMYVQNEIPFEDVSRFQPLFDALDQNPVLTTVVYAMLWPRRLSDLDDDAAFEARLAGTLSRLKAFGVQVFVAGDLPWFASEPAYCKFEVVPGNERYCSALRSDAEAARERYAPMITRVTEALGVPVIPLRDALCTADGCSMVRDGRLMLRDSNHLTVEGSLLLGGRVSEWVLATP